MTIHRQREGEPSPFVQSITRDDWKRRSAKAVAEWKAHQAAKAAQAALSARLPGISFSEPMTADELLRRIDAMRRTT